MYTQKASRVLRKIAGVLVGVYAVVIIASLIANPETGQEIKSFNHLLMYGAISLSFLSWILDKRNKYRDKKRKRDSLPLN
jgi:uncharacterized membrane protein YvlD (DUF360 family)